MHRLVTPMILAAATLPCLAFAQSWPTVDTHTMLLTEWHPATAAELDAARGGFAMANNITLDFGFEALVLVDGILQSHTRLSVPELATDSIDPGTMDLVKIANIDGVPTHAATGMDGFSLNTVIQNNLDQKIIQSLQVLDIRIGNFGSVYNPSLSQLMGQQIIQGLR
jgi:hypothetical protein